MVPDTVLAAGEEASSVVPIDVVWIMMATMLVFGMQAGFALLEAGSARMKNAGHIAGKQVLSFALAAVVFWAFGYGIMFDEGNALFGTGGFFLTGFDPGNLTVELSFLFQLAFAAVSLAIVWGGFAERAKLSTYFIFGILYLIVIYPVIGHWIWGGGWLASEGKLDFAGSTVVHLTGAVAGFVATVLLGPRLGKFNKDGSPNVLPGHNQVYTVLGGVILWIGWFGFNAGSTLGVGDGFFAYVALTTMLAAASGAIAALVTAKMISGKADVPAMVNGVLSALVAITAGCAFVEPWAAVVIGVVAGSLTYWTALYFERKGIDDPIYGFHVHGLAGIWGTIAIGLFAAPGLVGETQLGLFYGGGFHQLWIQTLGVFVSGGYAALVSFIILIVLKALMGLRVSEEEEVTGLDVSEHGAYGYPEHLDPQFTSKTGETPSGIVQTSP
ncbi:MAG: ammonium transporter [Bacillaceae bacterium]|nr:ammonium transporter [Bacillaceae bacterium]